MWLAALDAEKAYDGFNHDDFCSLLNYEIDADIASMAKGVYSGLRAYVELEANVVSRVFNIERGAQQGDPPVSFLL